MKFPRVELHHFFTRTRLITLAVSSFSLFIFSIVLAFVILPLIIDNQIDKNVRLERGTEQWHRFKQLPFNISFNVTLFAVENVEDVVKLGAKPKLSEKGPYVFDQVQVRKNISYNDNNNTITYGRKLEFHFNQTRSGSAVSIDDTITTINPIYVAIMQVLKDQNLQFFAKTVDKCMNKMFNNTPYILKDYPVRNLMFDGMKICDFNAKECKYFVISLCKQFAITKTIEEVKDGKEHYMKFSLFNYKQAAPDGVYDVNSGMDDISQVGSIEQWNFSNVTSLWEDSLQNNTCNVIKGTDGTLFPPHLTKDFSASIFATDLCRTVSIFYNGSGTYKDIEGYYYTTKPSLFYASTDDPSQDCYCPTGTSTLDENGQKSCYLDGVIDIYPCLGLPVLVSQPHFLNANEKYLHNLTGDIQPDPEKHGIYALLDKYTGIPLSAHQRVQLNLMMRPSDKFPSSAKFARTILPLCWIDQGLDLPDSGVELLNSLLYDTLSLVNILKWVFIGVSFCLTIFSGVLLALHLYSP